MKLFLFFIILILLLLFIYNKKEYFTDKIIIGDVSYEDYSINDTLVSKFLADKLLKPRKISYALGIPGMGLQDNISTINFKAKNIKDILPEAIDKYGEQEIVNLESLIPILLHIIQKHNVQIENNKQNFIKFEKELLELKKKI